MYMGNGTEGIPSTDAVHNYASEHNVSNHRAAIQLGSPLSSKPLLWPEIVQHVQAEKSEAPNLTLSTRGDLLTTTANAIGEYLQFPKSTIFLHGLACISSVLNRKFVIDYSIGEHMVPGIYAVTAQPASTGKSFVNKYFSTPILVNYKKINDLNHRDREGLKREIKSIERELEGIKGNKEDDRHQEIEAIDRLEEKTEALRKIPAYKPITTNATIEALEDISTANDGMFSMISAEADGLNVVVGNSYGDKNSKKNIEIVLKGWDYEYFSSDRVGRDGYTGLVRSSIAVIAQDDTIDTMLAAGESGRGITGRFLIVSEGNMLGDRDHMKKRAFDMSLKTKYNSLISNILAEDEIVISFSTQAEKQIQAYKQGVEPYMKDGARYSDGMAREFIGKADKHLRKIATVLHCIDNWQDGGNRSRTVEDDHVIWAIQLFEQLSKTFITSADYYGYSGEKSEIDKIIQVINQFAEKGKSKIPFSLLREKVRNVKPFRGSSDVTKKLKDKIIPALEELNYCVLYGQDIHINPRLK